MKSPHHIIKDNKLWSLVFLLFTGGTGGTAIMMLPKVMDKISMKVASIEHNQLRIIYQNEREWIYRKQERDLMRVDVADNQAFRNIYDKSNIMRAAR